LSTSATEVEHYTRIPDRNDDFVRPAREAGHLVAANVSLAGPMSNQLMCLLLRRAVPMGNHDGAGSDASCAASSHGHDRWLLSELSRTCRLSLGHRRGSIAQLSQGKFTDLRGLLFLAACYSLVTPQTMPRHPLEVTFGDSRQGDGRC
jgi:hypothetical protein